MFNLYRLCRLVSYLIVSPIYVHDEEPSKTYITQDEPSIRPTFYLKLFVLIQAQHRLKAQTFLGFFWRWLFPLHQD